MKKVLLGLLLALVLVGVGFFIYTRFFVHGKHVHLHAGFQVYVDDTLQDFSDWKYMHQKPCTVDGKQPDEPEDEQIEKAHLHEQIGDVVHVHREGAKWKDLFVNLKYPIDEKNLFASVNGEKVENILNREIAPYDSVVFFIGKHKDDKQYLEKAVKKEHIQEIEKKSELCATGN